LPQYSSILTGIHSLSESLIKKIFDFKYGRASSPVHVKSAFEKDIKDLIVLLSQNFPIAISTGNLGWWDLFRPFSEELQGLTHKGKIGNLPVARNPLTNTFYRQPIVEGKIFSEGPVLHQAKHPFLEGNILQTRLLLEQPNDYNKSLCLPGPFSFSRAVSIDSTGSKVYKTRDALMTDFSEILKDEFRYLSTEGYSHIVMDESSITWEKLDSDSSALLIDLWNQIISDSSLKVVLHTYNRLTDVKLQMLLESNAWAIGIDCIRNSPQELVEHDFNGKILLAGVIDSQSYLRDAENELIVENTTDLVRIGIDLAETQSNHIILAPTTRLEFVPRSVADLKLQHLGKAIKELQEM
jgi:methionine synthase II (cobalamin-independent)